MEANWVQDVLADKSCIIVTRRGKKHIRRYGRDVKGGISAIEALSLLRSEARDRAAAKVFNNSFSAGVLRDGA